MPRATIRALRQGGIRRIVLATGDRAEVADAVGAITGVDEVLAGRTPAGKLEVVRREQRHGPVIMAGDGINDAPAAGPGRCRGRYGRPRVTRLLRSRRRGAHRGPPRPARRSRRARRAAPAGSPCRACWPEWGCRWPRWAVAAAGLLPAVWGALLQEAIDVAVILNALRVLHPGYAARAADGRRRRTEQPVFPRARHHPGGHRAVPRGRGRARSHRPARSDVRGPAVAPAAR